MPTTGRARLPFLFYPENEMWRSWKVFWNMDAVLNYLPALC